MTIHIPEQVSDACLAFSGQNFQLQQWIDRIGGSCLGDRPGNGAR